MQVPIDELKNRLRQALAYMNMKPIDLSKKTGIPKSSISQYMSGHVKPNSERVYLISKALNVSEAWLMGFDVEREREAENKVNLQPPTIADNTVTFPVIGNIAAGYDNIALEDWSGDTVEIPASYLKGRNKDDFFVLCVKGDSMFPEYRENDKVLILKQSTMDYSGQVGAVIYDDENATLKKIEYKFGEDWMRLVPINPNHPIKNIKDEALEHCRVLGIPQYLIREIEQ